MTNGIILTRTGDGNWYIKHTCLNDTLERAAALIKSLKCDSDDNSDD